MSQKSGEEENVGIEEIIDQTSEQATSEVVSSTLPEAPDLRGAIERDLQAKIDAGENLSVGAVYKRIYNEISQKNNCSYAYVSKIAKAYLKKKSEPETKTTKVDSNKIEIQTVTPESRPAPKSKPKPTLESVISQSEPLDKERLAFELEFESSMMQMSLENIAGIMRTIGIPAPQASKIKRQAKLIAMFNQSMVNGGHPEKRIDMGERLLPLMLKISVIGMFAEPIGKAWQSAQKKSDQDKGIIQESSSMRE